MEYKCPYDKECGGCKYLSISYEEELKQKQAYMQNLFKPLNWKETIEVVGADDPYYYRNKVQMAFKLSKTKQMVSGIYQEHSHNIITVSDCLIQNEVINRVLKSVNKAMSMNKILPAGMDRGFVRHVLVRYAVKTKQILVCVVTKSDMFPGRADFVKDLLRLEPEITTIVQNINERDTVIVLGTKERVLYGPGFIVDELCGLKFKLSARSFYQINPAQTEKLYGLAIDYANLRKDNIVLDAYSGIGTIGLSASKNAKKVVCVENNPDAVKDARANGKNNNITNTEFFLEDSTKFINDLARSNGKIDLVFLDPPRTGTTYPFISAIDKLKVKRCVYVSCGPESLIRDIKIFKDFGYDIKKVKCVDMFPRTPHVETVVLLEKNEGLKQNKNNKDSIKKPKISQADIDKALADLRKDINSSKNSNKMRVIPKADIEMMREDQYECTGKIPNKKYKKY